MKRSKQQNWLWGNTHWWYGGMLRERKKKIQEEKHGEMTQRNEEKSFITGYPNLKKGWEEMKQDIQR